MFGFGKSSKAKEMVHTISDSDMDFEVWFEAREGVVRMALEERKSLLSFEALGRTLSYSPYLSRFGLEHFRREVDTPPYHAYGMCLDSESFTLNPELHLYHASSLEQSDTSKVAPYAYVIDLCKLLYVDRILDKANALDEVKNQLGLSLESSQEHKAYSKLHTSNHTLAKPNPLEAISLLRRHSKLPIIHADIFIDEYQILESALFGADLLLMPCVSLDNQTLSKLLEFARRLELECFVYVRNPQELKRAIFSGANALYVPESSLESLLSLIPNTQIIASDSSQDYGVDVEICLMDWSKSESSKSLSEV